MQFPQISELIEVRDVVMKFKKMILAPLQCAAS
jgi:hypothetical protein